MTDQERSDHATARVVEYMNYIVNNKSPQTRIQVLDELVGSAYTLLGFPTCVLEQLLAKLDVDMQRIQGMYGLEELRKSALYVTQPKLQMVRAWLAVREDFIAALQVAGYNKPIPQ